MDKLLERLINALLLPLLHPSTLISFEILAICCMFSLNLNVLRRSPIIKISLVHCLQYFLKLSKILLQISIHNHEVTLNYIDFLKNKSPRFNWLHTS